MQVNIHDTAKEMARAVAEIGGATIGRAIEKQGSATIILATGASQFDMLDHLTSLADINWSVVTAWHLDEYCGVDKNHPVSFRRYMRERFTDKLPALKRFVWIEGDADDLGLELQRLNGDIAKSSIDIAFIGIGENGHLAFNDPPADFAAEVPFQVVALDEKSCQQQVNEGWFEHIDDVPQKAISMSLRQIMKSKMILTTVPDKRKATAVKDAVEGPICRSSPASILRVHKRAELHLDLPAASELEFFIY